MATIATIQEKNGPLSGDLYTRSTVRRVLSPFRQGQEPLKKGGCGNWKARFVANCYSMEIYNSYAHQGRPMRRASAGKQTSLFHSTQTTHRTKQGGSFQWFGRNTETTRTEPVPVVPPVPGQRACPPYNPTDHHHGIQDSPIPLGNAGTIMHVATKIVVDGRKNHNMFCSQCPSPKLQDPLLHFHIPHVFGGNRSTSKKKNHTAYCILSPWYPLWTAG